MIFDDICIALASDYDGALAGSQKGTRAQACNTARGGIRTGSDDARQESDIPVGQDYGRHR